ncbi:MAG: DUF2652 domain-containing protein [Anaerolineales bacterium]
METKTQHGYLILADISGYTSYLAGVELDHADEIITSLLEIIVGQFKQVLTISKLEGDAVFAYAPEAKLTRGETLLELIESTYVAFCDRRDSSHRRTICECKACQNIPNLDLKFFIHHGDYVIQQISGIHELVGSDVNVAHRLMKNHLAEATGWKAYALFTERGLEHLGVRPTDMHAQIETYEHLGDVPIRSFDLHARREELLNARREVIRPNDADYIVTCEYPAPPPVVWEWLTEPRRRTLWAHGAKFHVIGRPRGRMGAGAVNHCDHGKTTTIETFLDWRPFDYFTARSEDPGTDMIETVYLEPLGDGTRTRDVIKFLKFPFPLPRPLAVALMRFLMKNMLKYEDMWKGIGPLIADEQKRAAGEAFETATYAYCVLTFNFGNLGVEALAGELTAPADASTPV